MEPTKTYPPRLHMTECNTERMNASLQIDTSKAIMEII